MRPTTKPATQTRAPTSARAASSGRRAPASVRPRRPAAAGGSRRRVRRREPRASRRASVSVTIPPPSPDAEAGPGKRDVGLGEHRGESDARERRGTGVDGVARVQRGPNLPLNARRRSSWKRPEQRRSARRLERRHAVERRRRVEHGGEGGEVERDAAGSRARAPTRGVSTTRNSLRPFGVSGQTSHRAQRERAPGGTSAEVQEPARLAVRAERERVEVVARGVGHRVLEGHREPVSRRPPFQLSAMPASVAARATVRSRPRTSSMR